MSKRRALQQQIRHAIAECSHIGESKRNYKMQHNGQTDERVFSIQTKENLVNCASSFSKYVKREHPEVKWARDITQEVVQQWLDANKDNWNQSTMRAYISAMKKIAKQLNATYKNCHVDLEGLKNNKEQNLMDKERNVIMERTDYEALCQSLRTSQAQARVAIEIAGRSGLRAKEISRLKTKNIDLDKNILLIDEGAKNGKKRTVPIRPKDREFYARLKENLESKNQAYVCDGVSEDSLNSGIREKMKELKLDKKYKNTTIHSIRKMYAKERYEEKLAKGYNEEKAWSVVQKEIGHEARFRQFLFNVYVLGE